MILIIWLASKKVNQLFSLCKFFTMYDKANWFCYLAWLFLHNLHLKARIPSSVLECAIVSREINFSSNEEISNLKLRQTLLLNEHCIEEWFFTFGYVIPNSTNTWQQVIKSAGKGKMMSPEILSGNVIIDTKFYDEESVIFENRMRVYYIWDIIY